VLRCDYKLVEDNLRLEFILCFLLAGGSGEVVSLDVGQCHKSCTSVPSVMESHIVDFDSAESKVSPSITRHHYTLKLS
jgi:hypothetical protein